MTDRLDHGDGEDRAALDDDALLAAVRDGDTGAYALLYQRHREDALRLARRVGDGHDPQDIAQEVFFKVLTAILRGGGPRRGFAGYLMRAVRNEAIDRRRRAQEVAVEDVETVDAAQSARTDGADARIEKALMQQAFSSLPENWQQILWLTEVEGLAPRTVAPRLRQSPSAVAQLSRRAREGLRTAWLQAHVDLPSARAECRQTAALLGAYERGQLTSARTLKVEEHLEGCARCSAVLVELREVSSRLRGALLPLVLGSPLLMGSMSGALGGTTAVLGSSAVVGAGLSSGVVASTGLVTSLGATVGGLLGRMLRWQMVSAVPGGAATVAGTSVAVLVGAMVLTVQLPDPDSAAAGGGHGGSAAYAATVPTPLPSTDAAPEERPTGESGVLRTETAPPPAPASPVETGAPGVPEPGGPATPEEPAMQVEPAPAAAEPATPEGPAPTAEPVVPVQPEEPVKPEEPAEPVEPEEPVESEEPVGPADPEAPVDPVDPVEPDPENPDPVDPDPVDPDPEGPVVAAPTFEFPAGGSYALPITLRGDGIPGAEVQILDDAGQVADTTTVAEDGTWVATPSPGVPDAPVHYSAVQQVDGVSSPSSEPTPEYVFLAPDPLNLDDGTTLAVNTELGNTPYARTFLQLEIPAAQPYVLIVDGAVVHSGEVAAGTVARCKLDLHRGEHTLVLAHRDPVTGSLGAERTLRVTVE